MHGTTNVSSTLDFFPLNTIFSRSPSLSGSGSRSPPSLSALSPHWSLFQISSNHSLLCSSSLLQTTRAPEGNLQQAIGVMNKCVPLCTDTDAWSDYRYLDTLYLFHHYCALLCITCIMLQFIVASSFTFLVPFVLDSSIIDGLGWDVRFRILTTMLISVPLVVACLVGLFA